MNKWIQDEFSDYQTKKALNSHAIPHILRSPAHYKNYIESENKDNESFAIGRLIHTCILEPEKLSNVCIEPEGDKRSSKHREVLKEWKDSLSPNAIVCSQDVYDRVMMITESVHAHPTISTLLNGGFNERSGYLTCPEYGIDVKIRPDKKKDNLLIDIKTSTNASYNSFQRDVINYSYDVQAAFYLHYGNILSELSGEGKIDAFIWIVIEKEPPYACAIYIADDSFLRIGMSKCIKAIKLYENCVKINKWLSYDIESQIMMPPTWYKELSL